MTASGLLERLARALRERGETAILEDDGLALADALGVPTPVRRVVSGAGEVDDALLDTLPGDRVVVKVLSARVVHRFRAGGIAVVPRRTADVREAVSGMAARFGATGTRWLLEAWVPPAVAGAGELLLALRCTEAWGPVVIVGPGGVATESRSDALREGQGPWMASLLTGVGAGPRGRSFVGEAAAGSTDPGDAAVELAGVAARLLELGPAAMKAGLAELEFNPLRWGPGGWVALDALGGLGPAPDPAAPAPAGAGVDPSAVAALLEADSLAVVGASARDRNPGRIILTNVLEAGFDAASVQVVKPGRAELDGCRCVPDVASLDPVDLLVVAVSAGPAAAVAEEALRLQVAKAILLIPGGMEAGTAPDRPMDRVAAALAAARAEGSHPVVVGPNSLGIRSAPGRFDTLFLPRDRVRFPGGSPAPVALVSQSGAFALTRLASLPGVEPRYVITLGNQMDLTLGRTAEALALDSRVQASAWYVEGFAPGDGGRWLGALRSMTGEGRPAVVYAAGRTDAGRDAAASHTASVAGDPRVLRELCARSGVAVVETLSAFEDALALLAAWAGRDPPGRRLGVISNAGFETVAAADGAEGLEIPPLAAATRAALAAELDAAGVGGLVPVVHPLDVTPMLGDTAFVRVAEVVLGDPGVEVGVVGCVPLTPALDTPLGGPGDGADGVTAALVDLWRRTTRPWLVVLDAGPGHEWMRDRLRREGIPVLAGMDRVGPALRAVLAGRPGAHGPP